MPRPWRRDWRRSLWQARGPALKELAGQQVMERALDCKYSQVLVQTLETKAGFNWLHAVLLHRVEGPCWDCLTPDHDLVLIDFMGARIES